MNLDLSFIKSAKARTVALKVGHYLNNYHNNDPFNYGVIKDILNEVYSSSYFVNDDRRRESIVLSNFNGVVLKALTADQHIEFFKYVVHHCDIADVVDINSNSINLTSASGPNRRPHAPPPPPPTRKVFGEPR